MSGWGMAWADRTAEREEGTKRRRDGETERWLADVAGRYAWPVDTETLRQRVKEIEFWYHRIELPAEGAEGGEGVVTPGVNPLRPAAYQVPADLTGLRVLDVGAWDGYWTFEALKRGAREAVAIDDFSDYLGHLKPEQRHAWKSFDLCREALGYTEDRCSRIEMSVYDVTEARLGRFDLVLFFGTLYHLRHPLLALDRLGAVCDREIIVESAVCDDYSPYRGGIGRGYTGKQLVMEFYPTMELAMNATNWWAPTVQCLTALVFAAGFPKVQGWKLEQKPKEVGHCRGFCKGTKG
jgi:tRNA (mo5U34)-methyltransferase